MQIYHWEAELKGIQRSLLDFIPSFTKLDETALGNKSDSFQAQSFDWLKVKEESELKNASAHLATSSYINKTEKCRHPTFKKFS